MIPARLAQHARDIALKVTVKPLAHENWITATFRRDLDGAHSHSKPTHNISPGNCDAHLCASAKSRSHARADNSQCPERTTIGSGTDMPAGRSSAGRGAESVVTADAIGQATDAAPNVSCTSFLSLQRLSEYTTCQRRRRKYLLSHHAIQQNRTMSYHDQQGLSCLELKHNITLILGSPSSR